MSKIIKAVLIFIFAVSLSAAGNQTEHKEGAHAEKGHVCYKSIAMQISQFAKTEEYDKAMELLVKAKDNPDYGHHMEHIYTSMAFLNQKTGKYDDNIPVWKEGHEKGIVFNINPKQSAYEPYLKIKGFDQVAKKDAELKAEKAKNPVKDEDCDNHEK